MVVLNVRTPWVSSPAEDPHALLRQDDARVEQPPLDLGVDAKVILTPPCIFCIVNHYLEVLVKYTVWCENDINAQG